MDWFARSVWPEDSENSDRLVEPEGVGPTGGDEIRAAPIKDPSTLERFSPSRAPKGYTVPNGPIM